MSAPRIYVASSWRNALQPSVVTALRLAGFDVYDFRNPAPGNHGFHWSAIDPEWKGWDPKRFRNALEHPVAAQGFKHDMNALEACDLCVLVLPCGRSAHLEAGYAVGAGKPTWILMTEPQEPELMYRMTAGVVTSLVELVESLDAYRQTPDRGVPTVCGVCGAPSVTRQGVGLKCSHCLTRFCSRCQQCTSHTAAQLRAAEAEVGVCRCGHVEVSRG